MSQTIKRPAGMHPQAFEAYSRAFEKSGLPHFRIIQTCTGALQGRVLASAGTHDKDGILGSGEAYSAAVDLSVWRVCGVARWDEAHLKWCLFNLAMQGFVGWYRHTGSFLNNKHLHCVFVGVPMKPMLQRQVADFLANRTGLKGHATEGFWTAPASVDAHLKQMFDKANS